MYGINRSQQNIAIGLSALIQASGMLNLHFQDGLSLVGDCLGKYSLDICAGTAFSGTYRKLKTFPDGPGKGNGMRLC